MGLEASAQKVDLVKLGNTLRNKNLSMVLGIEEGDRFVVRDNATELVGIMNLKGEMLVQPKYQDIIRKQTYGSNCVMRHASMPDKHRRFGRFKVFRSKNDEQNAPIGQIA